MSSRSPIHTVESLLLGLSDPTRLRLLSLMRGQEICVCFFTAVLGAPQPTVSRHLAYLRQKGLVSTRKAGKWVHYRLSPPSDPAVAEILSAVLDAVANDPEIKADKKRLGAACCNPAKLVGIADAPVPASMRRLDGDQSPFSSRQSIHR